MTPKRTLLLALLLAAGLSVFASRVWEPLLYLVQYELSWLDDLFTPNNFRAAEARSRIQTNRITGAVVVATYYFPEGFLGIRSNSSGTTIWGKHGNLVKQTLDGVQRSSPPG